MNFTDKQMKEMLKSWKPLCDVAEYTPPKQDKEPIKPKFEVYPENYSEQRPFFVEINTNENGEKRINIFKAQYFEDLKNTPFSKNGEAHPWNLNVYHDLEDVENPYIVSFWTEKFIKFVVDSINDKFEKEYNKNI